MIALKDMPNKSVISITIQTNFKPQIEDGEDNRKDIVQRFHTAIYDLVQEMITENEELEQNIMEKLQDDWLPKKTMEFSDLGEISIAVAEESSELKQDNLMDDEVEEYLKGIKKKELPKSQTKLNEVTGNSSQR